MSDCPEELLFLKQLVVNAWQQGVTQLEYIKKYCLSYPIKQVNSNRKPCWLHNIISSIKHQVLYIQTGTSAVCGHWPYTTVSDGNSGWYHRPPAVHCSRHRSHTAKFCVSFMCHEAQRGQRSWQSEAFHWQPSNAVFPRAAAWPCRIAKGRADPPLSNNRNMF